MKHQRLLQILGPTTAYSSSQGVVSWGISQIKATKQGHTDHRSSICHSYNLLHHENSKYKNNVNYYLGPGRFQTVPSNVRRQVQRIRKLWKKSLEFPGV